MILILLLPFGLDLWRATQTDFQGSYCDFRIFRAAAESFTANPDTIYRDRPNYLYPPLFLLLFSPLLKLPEPWPLLTFQIFKWLAAYACLHGTWRMVAPRGEDVPPVVALGTLVLVFRPFANDFGNGNINVFVLAGVIAGLRLAQLGRSVLAGATLTLMACLKVTPALLVAYLLYKRQWGVIAGGLLGAVLGLIVVPGAALGWQRNFDLLRDWHAHLIGGYVESGGVYSIGTNQGVVALMNRLLGDAIAFEPDERITLVRLPDGALAAARAAIAGAILASLAWACRGRLSAATAPAAFGCEVGMVLIAMLALSGYAWKAHYVAMLPVYAVLLAILADARSPRSGRRACIAFLILSVIFAQLSSDFVTPALADRLLAYGAMLYSGLAAAVALWIARASLRAEESGRAPVVRAG